MCFGQKVLLTTDAAQADAFYKEEEYRKANPEWMKTDVVAIDETPAKKKERLADEALRKSAADKLKAPDTADALLASRARSALLKNRNQSSGRSGAFGLDPAKSLTSFGAGGGAPAPAPATTRAPLRAPIEDDILPGPRGRARGPR